MGVRSGDEDFCGLARAARAGAVRAIGALMADMSNAPIFVPGRTAGEDDSAGTPEESDGRRAARANLFLAATIEVGGMTSPVRVRDLSETGAQLEGPAFPQVGTRLILRRKDVEIGATVMWLAPPRCGLVFEGLISVAEWIAGTPGPTRFQGAPGEAAAPPPRAVRAAPSSGEGAAPVVKGPARTDGRVAEELAYVERLLKDAGETLRGDRVVTHHHPQALQGIDLAAEILGHLAVIMAAPDREAAIRAIDMEPLRARLLRKAIGERD
jgi:hypothetical protein